MKAWARKPRNHAAIGTAPERVPACGRPRNAWRRRGAGGFTCSSNPGGMIAWLGTAPHPARVCTVGQLEHEEVQSVMILRSTIGAAAVFFGIAVAACPAGTTAAPRFAAAMHARMLHAGPATLPAKALFALSTDTGSLEYWPLLAKGGADPTGITGGPTGVAGGALAANGDELALTNGNGVILYNVSTGATAALPDPDGYAADVAIDTNGSIYVVNFLAKGGNVVMYPAGSGAPVEINCGLLDYAETIAVDNEGDIFVNQNGAFTGVVEIPHGANGPDARQCSKLALKREPGYVGGIVVDPKTDDLVVLDDPDLCAGGKEGRVTVYPKPYQKSTGHSVELGANCAGTIRLNAKSSMMFVGDESVSGGETYILQRGYPSGKPLGMYSGGDPAGFVTIPNTLPD